MFSSIIKEQLLDVAKKFATPTYVYFADKIKSQYQQLTDAFVDFDVRFFYACKALTNISVLKYMKQLGLNIDCSSVNEVKLALYAGFEPKNILYTSNGIAFEEIEEVKNHGAIVNIDSISNLEKFGKKFGNTYPVGIRIRPNIMAGGNIKIATGHQQSKFGIPVEKIYEIVRLMKTYQLKITFLHFHTGSDIGDANVFVKGIETIKDLIPQFSDLQAIDLGGGFKVPYKQTDKAIDLMALANGMKTSFEKIKTKDGKPMQIWFEPGKYLVSECGYLITEVNVMKDNGDMVFAGINTGLNHLIRPMLYDAYHHITNLSNCDAPEAEYNVTGYICETDNFAVDRKIATIREGDILALHNCGAYSFEMSSNYNSRFKPAEVLIIDGETKLIRRRERFEDLIMKQFTDLSI